METAAQDMVYNPVERYKHDMNIKLPGSVDRGCQDTEPGRLQRLCKEICQTTYLIHQDCCLRRHQVFNR